MTAGSHPLVPPEWSAWMARLPADGGPSGADWAEGLPRLVDDLLGRWSLSAAGAGHAGWSALVVPVERDGEPLVLKVVWPHPQAAGEHLALRRWAGQGAVRLVAADPARGALLLERLDATRDLRSVDADKACEVLGGLLRRLNVPAPPTVRTLSETVRRELDRMAGREDLPRRVRTRVTGLARELLEEPAVDATLLHTDLRVENVLTGDREPWLAIGPKPMAGHPAFEVQPALQHRTAGLGAGAALRRGVRRRLAVTSEAAGIDEEMARLWSIVRIGIEASSAAGDGRSDVLSLHIATIKALED